MRDNRNNNKDNGNHDLINNNYQNIVPFNGNNNIKMHNNTQNNKSNFIMKKL